MEGKEKMNFKHDVYNKLKVTSNRADVTEKINQFILRLTGYRPGLNFIADVNEEEYVCPTLCIFKAILYLFYPTFKFHEKIKFYLDSADKHKTKLKEEYNVELESWENNWIQILESMLKRDTQMVKQLYLKNAQENPNDLLAFDLGMVFGLYSGDKEFFRTYADIFYRHEDNRLDGNFIGIYAFIKEELKEFEESEKWVIKGTEIDPNNIWIQHVYSHILYQTDRVAESINYLEERKHMWKENANNFTFKHITWHLAISYLEMEDYDKSNELMEEIVAYSFEDAECGLGILGFLLRAYIRTEGNLQNIHYKWCDIMLRYLKNDQIFTKHLLFDCLSAWLLSFLSSQQNDEARQILDKTMTKIQENVFSDELDNDIYADYYRTSYLNLLQSMILFGQLKFSESLEILKKEENNVLKLGASDEQLFVLFDVELYSSYKCNDKENFTRLVQNVYGDQLKTLKYIRKFEKNLNN